MLKMFQILYRASYNKKIQMIDFPIFQQDQQVNTTPESIWLRMHYFWDRASNLLAWKMTFPTPSSSPRDTSVALARPPWKCHLDKNEIDSKIIEP